MQPARQGRVTAYLPTHLPRTMFPSMKYPLALEKTISSPAPGLLDSSSRSFAWVRYSSA